MEIFVSCFFPTGISFIFQVRLAAGFDLEITKIVINYQFILTFSFPSFPDPSGPLWSPRSEVTLLLLSPIYDEEIKLHLAYVTFVCPLGLT
jgi:hypothetical protein